jgi:hypothetical protein
MNEWLCLTVLYEVGTIQYRTDPYGRQAGRQASRQAGRRSSSRVVFHDEAAKTLASLSTKVQRLPSAVLESIRTVQFTSSGLDFTLTFAIASLHQGKVIISSM